MASKKEKALGSGLGALFGSEQPLAPEKLPISKVEPRSATTRSSPESAVGGRLGWQD